MFRPLRRKDVLLLEEEFDKQKNDKTAVQIGKTYTRLEIARLEERRVPWLRRRRRMG